MKAIRRYTLWGFLLSCCALLLFACGNDNSTESAIKRHLLRGNAVEDVKKSFQYSDASNEIALKDIEKISSAKSAEELSKTQKEIKKYWQMQSIEDLSHDEYKSFENWAKLSSPNSRIEINDDLIKRIIYGYALIVHAVYARHSEIANQHGIRPDTYSFIPHDKITPPSINDKFYDSPYFLIIVLLLIGIFLKKPIIKIIKIMQTPLQEYTGQNPNTYIKTNGLPKENDGDPQPELNKLYEMLNEANREIKRLNLDVIDKSNEIDSLKNSLRNENLRFEDTLSERDKEIKRLSKKIKDLEASPQTPKPPPLHNEQKGIQQQTYNTLIEQTGSLYPSIGKQPPNSSARTVTKLYAAAPNGKTFTRVSDTLIPQESYFVIEALPNAEEGTLNLVDDNYNRTHAFSLVDILRGPCELRGTGRPPSPSSVTITPGKVKKEDGYWTIDKPIVLEWD